VDSAAWQALSYPIAQQWVVVTPRVTESLIELIKLQLSPNVRLIKLPEFEFELKDEDWSFQVLFSVDRLAQLTIFENLFELN
jgi:hypothetical protein